MVADLGTHALAVFLAAIFAAIFPPILAAIFAVLFVAFLAPVVAPLLAVIRAAAVIRDAAMIVGGRAAGRAGDRRAEDRGEQQARQLCAHAYLRRTDHELTIVRRQTFTIRSFFAHTVSSAVAVHAHVSIAAVRTSDHRVAGFAQK
jgi:hypothetical protein